MEEGLLLVLCEFIELLFELLVVELGLHVVLEVCLKLVDTPGRGTHYPGVRQRVFRFVELFLDWGNEGRGVGMGQEES